MDHLFSLDIILPCYNPTGNWPQKVIDSFYQIRQLLSDSHLNLIIVNDGSSKGIDSPKIDYLQKQIPGLRFEKNLVNEGKGSTLRKGVGISESDFQIYTDIDFPYLEKNVVALYQLLKEGKADIVIGEREKDYYKDIPKSRKIISKFLRFVNRNILKIPTSDTQAGLKGFNKKGREIFLTTKINRYLFDLEFLFLAGSRKDISILCIPVKLKEGVVFSKMNWKVIAIESLNFLKIFVRKISG